jgi:hypothetical protein
MTNNKKLKLNSSIKSGGDFPPIMKLKLPCYKTSSNCYEFRFHIYNHLNKRVNIQTINSGLYIKAFIELSEVWINDIEIGFNWNVLQLKVYPEFNFNTCLFIDDKVEEHESDKVNECYHCLYCPNQHVRTHYCTNNSIPYIQPPLSMTNSNIAPPPPPIISNKSNNNNNVKPISSFIPSVKDLLSVKLKPINKNDKKETDSNSPTLNDIINVKKNLKPKD